MVHVVYGPSPCDKRHASLCAVQCVRLQLGKVCRVEARPNTDDITQHVAAGNSFDGPIGADCSAINGPGSPRGDGGEMVNRVRVNSVEREMAACGDHKQRSWERVQNDDVRETNDRYVEK